MSAFFELRNLHGYYGKSHILQGIDLAVQQGELIALLGRNGAGKTTTMRAITGLLGRCSGDVILEGRNLVGLAPHEIARLGISLVPEHRGVFASLSVAENLDLAVRPGAAWTLDHVWEMFPALARRKKTGGGKLSGGEQQMLAIGRALLMGPKLLLLDEPTEGLAPVIVDEVVALLGRLKMAGLTTILVEQNLSVCQEVADRHAILDGGRIVWSGDTRALEKADTVRQRHLTLEHA